MDSREHIQEKRYSRFARKRKKKTQQNDQTKSLGGLNGKPHGTLVTKSNLGKSKRKLFHSSRYGDTFTRLQDNECLNKVKAVANRVLISKDKPAKLIKSGIFMFGKQSEFKKRDVSLNKITKARLDGSLERIIKFATNRNDISYTCTEKKKHKTWKASRKNQIRNKAAVAVGDDDEDDDIVLPIESSRNDRNCQLSDSESSGNSSSFGIIRFSPPAVSTKLSDDTNVPDKSTRDPELPSQNRLILRSHSETNNNYVSSSEDEMFRNHNDKDYKQFSSLIAESLAEITVKFPKIFHAPRHCLIETKEKLKQMYTESCEQDVTMTSDIFCDKNISKDFTSTAPTVRKEHLLAYVLLSPLHEKQNSSTQTSVDVHPKLQPVVMLERIEHNNSAPTSQEHLLPYVLLSPLHKKQNSNTRATADVHPKLQPVVQLERIEHNNTSAPAFQTTSEENSNNASSSLPDVPTPVAINVAESLNVTFDPVKYLKMNFGDGNIVRDQILKPKKLLYGYKSNADNHRMCPEKHSNHLLRNQTFQHPNNYQVPNSYRQNPYHLCKLPLYKTVMPMVYNNASSSRSVPGFDRSILNSYTNSFSVRSVPNGMTHTDKMKLFSYNSLVLQRNRNVPADQTNIIKHGNNRIGHDFGFPDKNKLKITSQVSERKSPSPEMVYSRCKMF